MNPVAAFWLQYLIFPALLATLTWVLSRKLKAVHTEAVASRAEIAAVRWEVQNTHSTNLRDDIDGLREELGGVRTDLRDVHDEVRGVREDISGLRRDDEQQRRDLRNVRERVTRLERVTGVTGT